MTSALTSVRPSAHSLSLCTLQFLSLPFPVVENQQQNINRTLQPPSVSDGVEIEVLGCAMGLIGILEIQKVVKNSCSTTTSIMSCVLTIGITEMHKVVQGEL